MKVRLQKPLFFLLILVFVISAFSLNQISIQLVKASTQVLDYDTTFNNLTITGSVYYEVLNTPIYGVTFYGNYLHSMTHFDNQQKWITDNELIVPQPNLNTSEETYFGFWLYPTITNSVNGTNSVRFSYLWSGTGGYLILYFLSTDGVNYQVNLYSDSNSAPTTANIAIENLYWFEFGLFYSGGVWQYRGYINGTSSFGSNTIAIAFTSPTIKLAYHDTIGNAYTLGNWYMSNPIFEYNHTFPPTNNFNSITYDYSISPIPVVGSFPISWVMSQGTTYTYNGYIYLNSQLTLNGTYFIETSGLSLSQDVSNSTSVVLSGTITKGQFTFQFAPRNNPNIVYEAIYIFWNVSTFASYETYVLEWTTVSNPSIPSGTGFAYLDLSIFIGIFMVIFIPAMIMGIYFGRNGFFVGLILVTGIGVISGLMPIWFAFLLAIGLIALLFTNNIGGIKDRF
jgi:hypothetical protein